MLRLKEFNTLLIIFLLQVAVHQLKSNSLERNFAAIVMTSSPGNSSQQELLSSEVATSVSSWLKFSMLSESRLLSSSEARC